ncbi:MAG: hypothetical protein RIT04_152 [Candidatus Parcubacteria bacterium]
MKPTLLRIAQLGNPILRKKAKLVKAPYSQEIRTLVADMIATADDAGGVGIAAPQVYQSLQLFIIASMPTPAYPRAPRIPPTAIINPVVISKSRATVKDWEGCLSIPNLRAQVSRAASVKVEYTDINKPKRIRKTFTGLAARIFQHEFDHIQGILFIDRVRSKDLVSEIEYMRQIKAKNKKVKEKATKKGKRK